MCELRVSQIFTLNLKQIGRDKLRFYGVWNTLSQGALQGGSGLRVEDLGFRV